MIVITIPILSDNYSYLIIDKNNKTCSAVDPASPKEIIPYLEKKKLHLKNILNTHYNSDHTAGNLDLKKISGLTVINLLLKKQTILNPNHKIMLKRDWLLFNSI